MGYFGATATDVYFANFLKVLELGVFRTINALRKLLRNSLRVINLNEKSERWNEEGGKENEQR